MHCDTPIHCKCKFGKKKYIMFFFCSVSFPDYGVGCATMKHSTTVDREIFVVYKFSSVPYNDENTNIFQHRIIKTKLHFRYADATKIKQI